MLIKASIHEVRNPGKKEERTLIRQGTVSVGVALEAFATMIYRPKNMVEAMASEQFSMLCVDFEYLSRLRTVSMPSKPEQVINYRYTFSNNGEHFPLSFRIFLNNVGQFVTARPERCSLQAQEFVKKFTLCQ